MTARRTLLVVLGVCVSLLGLQSPAAAAGYECPDGFVVDVSAAPTEFTIAAVCVGHMTRGDGGGQGDGDPGNESTPVAEGGTWVYDGYVCGNGGMCASSEKCPDGSVKKLYYYVSADGERGPTRAICPGDPDDPGPSVTPPTPVEIFAAFKKVAPTKAVLAVQPPDGQTLVNFETVFSTVADPFTTPKIDLVPGFSVEFEIFPKSFTWKFGDGAELASDWAGKPYAEGIDVSTLINHVYTTTDDVQAAVTTTWGAKVRINGGPPQEVDGTVSVRSPDVALEILEAKPTLVR